MKKLMGLGLAAVVLASCSGDDSGSVNNNDNDIDMGLLQGKWYRVSKTANGQTIMHEHEECAKDYIEFAADGILMQADVWFCDGEEPTYMEYDGTYTVDGNDINISIWGASASAEVQTLNEDTLIVEFIDDLDEDGDEESVIEEYTSVP